MRSTAPFRLAAAACLVVATCLLPGRAVAAARVQVAASVDGHALGRSSQNEPLKLFPRQQSVLTVTVTNRTSATITIRQVRLEGQVIGLNFFAYNTAVSMPVDPGQAATQSLSLDLSGLDGQATGLIPGAVQVLDAHHSVVAEQDGVVDVRGSLRSVYGLFGLGVALLTALSFLGALVGLARHRLQPNRWRRGLRFLTPGLGLGLVVNFTLSATRTLVPALGRWVTITALCALALFAMGYLTPAPDVEYEPPVTAPTPLVDEDTVVAVATGRHFAAKGRHRAPPVGNPQPEQALPQAAPWAAFPASADPPELPAGTPAYSSASWSEPPPTEAWSPGGARWSDDSWESTLEAPSDRSDRWEPTSSTSSDQWEGVAATPSGPSVPSSAVPSDRWERPSASPSNGWEPMSGAPSDQWEAVSGTPGGASVPSPGAPGDRWEPAAAAPSGAWSPATDGPVVSESWRLLDPHATVRPVASIPPRVAPVLYDHAAVSDDSSEERTGRIDPRSTLPPNSLSQNP